VEELLSQAQSATKATQFGKALKLCRQALEQKPNDMEALSTCAIASCKLKQGPQAKKFIRRIKNPQRKSLLNQICLTESVPGFE
jgi:Flp pilus assembly protein TadD